MKLYSIQISGVAEVPAREVDVLGQLSAPNLSSPDAHLHNQSISTSTVTSSLTNGKENCPPNKSASSSSLFQEPLVSENNLPDDVVCPICIDVLMLPVTLPRDGIQ